ncbi:hypothetical protein FGF1_23490 [Flavobacteriaceae bacterium GF1]
MRQLIVISGFLVWSAISQAANGERIAFPKAEQITENTVRIPFDLVDHLIVIEGQVLGKKGGFIIDTGAEALILNRVHYPKNLPVRRKVASSSGVMSAMGDVFQNIVDALLLSNTFSISKKKADIIDLSHIEKQKKVKILGIIGHNVLEDYEIFIDFYLKQLTLSRLGSSGNTLDSDVYLEKIADSLDFSLRRHTIVLRGEISNHFLSLGLDSAAELNQLTPDTHSQILKYFYPKKRVMVMGASRHKKEVLIGSLHRMKLSETVYLGPMTTMLSRMSRLNEAFGTELDGLLGYEFLKQKRVIINYKKRKLYFINFPIVSK